MATKTSKGKIATEIGAGLVAAGVAAAAGYYFYASKDAKKHRKIAAKWASDMKKEVLRETNRVKNINTKDFAKIVDTVASTYQSARSINAADVKRAAKELKANWEAVRREAGKTGMRGKKVVKKAVKKVAKKAVTKARKATKRRA